VVATEYVDPGISGAKGSPPATLPFPRSSSSWAYRKLFAWLAYRRLWEPSTNIRILDIGSNPVPAIEGCQRGPQRRDHHTRGI